MGNVQTDFDQSPSVLRLSGECDLALVDQLRQAGEDLLAQTPEGGSVAADLSEVSFMDSTMLGALIDLRRRAQDKDVTVILAAASPSVRRILDLTGLSDVFGG